VQSVGEMTGKLHLLMIILVSICKLTSSNVLCLGVLSYFWRVWILYRLWYPRILYMHSEKQV